MNAEELRGIVEAYFRKRHREFGLEAPALSVDYVLNWGGFVNHSYRVADGRRRYHLKLATSADMQEALRRWHALAPALEKYHAPSVLAWVDIGPAAGLLFPVVDGTPPTLTEEVVDALIPVLRRLNRDREIGAALGSRWQPTARDAYMSSFHARFTEDLRAIRVQPPPFVDAGLLDRLEDDVEAMARTVRELTAFDDRLDGPVHGDLWLNNVLWVDPSQWTLLDWDDLRIGDPAADIAALLGPAAADLRPLKHVERVTGYLTPAERERLPWLGRATLLDWVIDPLADWIDATTSSAHAELVRAEKERVHRGALELWRRS